MDGWLLAAPRPAALLAPLSSSTPCSHSVLTSSPVSAFLSPCSPLCPCLWPSHPLSACLNSLHLGLLSASVFLGFSGPFSLRVCLLTLLFLCPSVLLSLSSSVSFSICLPFSILSVSLSVRPTISVCPLLRSPQCLSHYGSLCPLPPPPSPPALSLPFPFLPSSPHTPFYLLPPSFFLPSFSPPSSLRLLYSPPSIFPPLPASCPSSRLVCGSWKLKAFPNLLSSRCSRCFHLASTFVKPRRLKGQ